MKSNNILAKMRRGRKAIGAVFTFASEELVEMLGGTGIDFVHFDAQHGSMSCETVERLCRVADLVGLTPTARVPANNPSTILRFLDRGVMGITCPDVNTREEAERLANACRYAPEGTRSFGSGRSNNYGQLHDRKEWMASTNADIFVCAQLESAASLENLEDIIAVPGIDFWAFGPNDLAQSMALTGQPDHPDVQRAIADAKNRIRRAHKRLAADVMTMFRVDEIVVQGAIARARAT
jgi:4-hydroxy-2-oxoheptanedioate aldolase